MAAEAASTGTWWVTEPDAVAPQRPNIGDGTAWEPRTTMQVLDEAVEKWGDRPALSWKVTKADEEFTSWTWAEYAEQVRAFGKSCIAVGMAPFKSVNIMGFNSKEWFVADVGCIAAGGLAAGIYTSSGPDAVRVCVGCVWACVCGCAGVGKRVC